MLKSFSIYTVAVLAAAMSFTACKKDKIAPFKQDVAFIKYYGHVLNQEGVDVKAITSAEGVTEYLILGSTYSFNETGNYRDFYLIKTDSLGNEIWSVKYGNDTESKLSDRHLALVQSGEEYDYDEVPRRLIVLADGSGYLLAGTRQRIEKDANGVDVPKEKRIVLYRVDADGAYLGDAVLRYNDVGPGDDFNNMYSDELFDIKELVDIDGATSLGFVLTGSSTNVDTLKPDYDANREFDLADVYTARLETDLSYKWQRTYGFIRSDKGTSIEIVDDGYIVVGTTEQRKTNSQNGDDFHNNFIFITYKQLSGNISNQNNFGSEDDEIESVHSCYDAENDVITGFGHAQLTSDENAGQLVIVQVNSNLQKPITSSASVVLPVFIPQQTGYKDAVAKHIYLLPNNGGFIASATTVAPMQMSADNFIESRDIHILKLDMSGGIVDEEKDQAYFGWNKEDVAGAVVPLIQTFSGSSATEIKSFVFTGTFNLGTNNAVGLVKVNSDLSFDPDGQEEE